MSITRTVAKNMTVLLFGWIVTLVLGMVFTALLSRHIGPEGYGKYAFAQSVVAMLMIFVNLGFNNVTIRDVAQRKEHASKYLSNIVSIKSLLAIIVVCCFLIITRFIGYSTETTLLILIVGINYFIDAVIQVFGSIFFAFEKMEYDVLTQVVRALVALGLGTGAIFLGYNLVQIVAVLISANVLRVILSFMLLSRKIVRIKPEFDLGFCKKVVIASLPFALLLVADMIFSNVNVLMLGALVNDEIVGWYAAALRIVTMLLYAPYAFLNSIYPVLSRFYVSSEESLALSYAKSYKLGLILQMPLAVGLFLIADPVIALVFGPGFEPAANALRLLSFVIGVSFTNYVCGGTMNAIGKERFFAGITWLEIPVVVVINWLLIPKFGYVGPAITYAISNWFDFILYSFLCHRWLRLPLPWSTGIRATLAMLLMAICVHYSLQGGVNLLVIVFIIGPAVYGGALYLLRVLSTEEIMLIRSVLKLK